MPSPDAEKRRRYWREYYYRHPDRARKTRVRKKNELAEWFQEVKTALACVRCDEGDPACLDFHHRDPDQKTLTLGNLRQYGWSRARVQKEIARCVVLCANCHRKLHAGRFSVEELDVAPAPDDSG